LATTPAASIATADASPQRCSGVVKAWHEERGMGFLTSNAGGEDIFVHRSDLSDGQWLVVGAHVTWEDGWDPGKSKKIAKNVFGAARTCGGGLAPAHGGLAPAPPLPDNMKSGVVKMWFADKAFGFIIPDGGGDDVMVHKNEVADGMELGQGMPVKYEATWDPIKGKFKASRCVAAFGAGSGPGCGAAAGRGPHSPSDNLFIAGLPLGFSEDMVWQLFGQYGPVSSVRVLHSTGKPDTAVLVRFADSHMATWMVDNLNGNIPVGLASPITVKFAGQGKAAGKGFHSDTGKGRYSPYATPTGASASGSGSALGSTAAAYSGAGGFDAPQYQPLHAHPGSQGLGMAAEVDATWPLDQGMSDVQSAPPPPPPPSACGGTPQSHAAPVMHSDSTTPPPPPPPAPPPPAVMSQQLLDESGQLAAWQQ